MSEAVGGAAPEAHHPDREADTSRAPGTQYVPAVSPQEITRLRRRLVRELVEANVLGASLVAVSYLVFQASKQTFLTRYALQIYTAGI